MKLIIVLLLSATLAACKTLPPPNTPSSGAGGASGGTGTNVNCVTGVEQKTIADAVARINTIIAQGTAAGSTDTVILKNLEGLGLDIGPDALACAYQYVASKLDFDAAHSTGDVAAERARRASIARQAIAAHGYTYASPGPS